MSYIEDFVFDLVDNWRDEHKAKFTGGKLLQYLSTDEKYILALLDSKTLLSNLFSVLLDIILKYKFRIIFAKVFNMIMCASKKSAHGNRMFIFQYVTSMKGRVIYRILRHCVENEDIAVLQAFTGIRAKVAKEQKFRAGPPIKRKDKSEYAQLEKGKLNLYRNYFGNKTLNVELCIIILSDLFVTLVGQPVLKKVFSHGDESLKILRLISFPSCLDNVELMILLCNVVGSLLQKKTDQASGFTKAQYLLVVTDFLILMKHHMLNARVIEAAVPVLLQCASILDCSNDDLINSRVLVIIQELTEIHSENIQINQNCTILKMTISQNLSSNCPSKSSEHVLERSGRLKKWSKRSSKQSRARAITDRSVPPVGCPSGCSSSTTRRDQRLRSIDHDS